MNRLFFRFAVALFMGVLYETSAKVARHRHHLYNSDRSCIDSLCWDIPHYPVTNINDVINEVRQILTSIPLDENKVKEIDPEVYEFSFSHDVDFYNIPEDVGDCKTKVEHIHPQLGYSRSQNFFIVNLPSIPQSVMSVQCKCQKSTHNRKCGQAYREERLLSLPAYKTNYNVGDLSMQKYKIPYGCAC